MWMFLTKFMWNVHFGLVHVSFCIYLSLSISLFLFLSIIICTYLSLFLFLSLSISLCVCLFLFMSNEQYSKKYTYLHVLDIFVRNVVVISVFACDWLSSLSLRCISFRFQFRNSMKRIRPFFTLAANALNSLFFSIF